VEKSLDGLMLRHEITTQNIWFWKTSAYCLEHRGLLCYSIFTEQPGSHCIWSGTRFSRKI